MAITARGRLRGHGCTRISTPLRRSGFAPAEHPRRRRRGRRRLHPSVSAGARRGPNVRAERRPLTATSHAAEQGFLRRRTLRACGIARHDGGRTFPAPTLLSRRTAISIYAGAAVAAGQQACPSAGAARRDHRRKPAAAQPAAAALSPRRSSALRTPSLAALAPRGVRSPPTAGGRSQTSARRRSSRSLTTTTPPSAARAAATAAAAAAPRARSPAARPSGRARRRSRRRPQRPRRLIMALVNPPAASVHRRRRGGGRDRRAQADGERTAEKPAYSVNPTFKTNWPQRAFFDSEDQLRRGRRSTTFSTPPPTTASSCGSDKVEEAFDVCASRARDEAAAPRAAAPGLPPSEPERAARRGGDATTEGGGVRRDQGPLEPDGEPPVGPRDPGLLHVGRLRGRC